MDPQEALDDRRTESLAERELHEGDDWQLPLADPIVRARLRAAGRLADDGEELHRHAGLAASSAKVWSVRAENRS